MSAAVIACLLWSVFFASPLPADTIKVKPPKINKTRKITPAIVNAFLRRIVMNEPIVGNDDAGAKMSLIATGSVAANIRFIEKVYEILTGNTRGGVRSLFLTRRA